MNVVRRYPEFFWNHVQPCIGDAIDCLELTIGGKQWVARLHNHIFQVDHRTSFIGPFNGHLKS